METAKHLKPYLPKTLLEILGTNRLIVEHHRGIVSYGPEELLIRATYGLLRIQGRELCIRCIRQGQLCVTGAIASVQLEGRQDDGAVE